MSATTQNSVIKCQTITTVAPVVKEQASMNLHEQDEKSFHQLRVLGGIAELGNIMSYCYGTENYYKIPQYSFNYTDGVKTFCEKADAYWLLDIVASISRHYKRMHEDFVIIDLIVGEDNKATITFEDTKGIFFKQDIPFTDCPKGLWKFYFDNNVFFWNGEY